MPHTWLTNQLTMAGGKELQGEVTLLRCAVCGSSARTHEARVDVCNALHTCLCERLVNQTRALLQSHSPCRHLRTTAA